MVGRRGGVEGSGGGERGAFHGPIVLSTIVGAQNPIETNKNKNKLARGVLPSFSNLGLRREEKDAGCRSRREWIITTSNDNETADWE